MDIDVSEMITQIESYPELWDRTVEGYKDKTTITQCWWDIASKIDEQFETRSSDEQTLRVQEMKKKWINVRDSWIKHYKLIKNNRNNSGTKKRKYIYYNQLKFLEKLMPCNEISAQQGETVSHEGSDVEDQKGYKVEPQAKRVRTTPSSTIRVNEDSKPRLSLDVVADRPAEDPRLFFFKGILPSIEHFNNDQFIDFQIGILQLIKKISSETNK